MVASNLSRPKFSIIPVAVTSIHIYIYSYTYIHVYIIICMDICEYVCVYIDTYIKVRIVNWSGCPRVPTGAHGCPRVSKKTHFFLLTPLENAFLRVKNARKSRVKELSARARGTSPSAASKITCQKRYSFCIF